MTIGDTCQIMNGGTPKTGVTSYWGGQHCWITPAEMGDLPSPYVGETRRTLTDDGMTNSSARLLPPNSVILSSRAPIGHLVINTVPMATNQGCKGLVPCDRLSVKFLFYYLRSIVGLLNDLGTGATFKELSGSKLAQVPIRIPPVAEQKRIIGILDQAFEAIDSANANAEKNLQNAQVLFDSYLDMRVSRMDHERPAIPLVELCEASRLITYGVIKLGAHVPKGIPCLRTSNVRRLRIETDGMKVIAPALSAEYSRTILRGGEVLVNVRGTLGGVAVVPEEMEGWNVSREVAVVPVAKSRINPTFAAYVIASGASQEWLGTMKKGATYVGINIEDLRRLPMPLPSETEQAKLVADVLAVAEEADRLQENNKKKLHSLQDLRASCLDRAFNGEI